MFIHKSKSHIISKNLLDKMLIAFFCIGITIPTLLAHHEIDRVSDTENRFFANPPKVILDQGNINTSFNYDFDNWISDNIRFRSLIVDVNAKFQYFLFKRIVRSDYAASRSGELYYTDSIPEYQSSNLFSENELVQFTSGLSSLATQLSDHGIKLYYMQCYGKEDFIPKNYLTGVNRLHQITRARQVALSVEENTDITTIPTYEALVAHINEERLFFETLDPGHWNEDGAYYGFQAMLTTLRNDFPEISSLHKSMYNLVATSSHADIYGLTYPLAEQYNVYEFKDPNAYSVDLSSDNPRLYDLLHSKEHIAFYKNGKSGNDLRILLVNDSFIRMFLKEDIAEFFSETLTIDNMNVSLLPTICNLYQPDIVILEAAAPDGAVGVVKDGLAEFAQ